MPTLNKVAELSGHTDRAWQVAWNPFGTLLASCSGDKTIRIWAQEGNQWICKSILEGGHNRTVRSVAWSPCGNYLASGSFDSTISIWDRTSGEFDCIATLEGHENEVKCVSYSASGNLLASCSRDKSVWVWEAEEDGEYECLSVLHEHSQDVKCVLWHPVDSMLASAGYDDSIKLYCEDEDDWTCYATLTGHASTVWSISFDKDGNFLASVSDDKSLKIWKRHLPGNKEGVPVQSIKEPKWLCQATFPNAHTRTIYSVSWSSVLGLIATAGADDCIRVFSYDEHKAFKGENAIENVCVLEHAHPQDVNCVAWNPKQGDILATSSDDGTIRIWNYVV